MSDVFRAARDRLSGMPSPHRDFAQEEADERRHMTEPFCVIVCSEDGDVTLQTIDRETLLKRLNESYWGNLPIHPGPEKGEFMDGRSRACIYIIKGEFVVPQPKRVVTEWDV